MSPIDQNVLVMRSRLMRVTHIPNPGVDDGVETPAFINPEHIILIMRGTARFGNTEDPESFKACPPQAGTLVMLSPTGHIYVSESPEEVAHLRDRALGHVPDKPRAL